MGNGSKKRRICVLTGSRSEYGILRPVMLAIRRRRELKLHVIAAGMHLSKTLGNTVGLIRADGIDVAATIEMDPGGAAASSMSAAVGRGILALTRALNALRPDILLVLGDRIEALAGAVAGAYSGIVVAHIHGGDVSRGGLDESARHAITKFSHIHFPATALSRERILRMGENPRHVYLAGAPGLDSILGEPLMPQAELSRVVGAPLPERFLILVQHPVTTQIAQARGQMRETLAAVRSLAMPTFIIYPNSDAGGRDLIREIESFRGAAFLRMFKNLPHRAYLSLLRHASALVGNSSSGIIEAPLFHLPVINIGIRQEGRQRSNNVIDVPHERGAICRAVKRALFDPAFRRLLRRCRSPYGDGRAGERIARTLARVRLDGLLQKQLAY